MAVRENSEEGSPIYQYLVDVNMDQEVEVATMEDCPTAQNNGPLFARKQTDFMSCVQNVVYKCCLPVTCLFQDYPRHKQLLLDVWKSKRLLDEDKKWIIFSRSTILSNTSKKPTFSSLYWLRTWSSGLGSVLRTPGVIILTASAALWLKRSYQHSKNRTAVTSLIQEIERLTSVAQKAYRLIKERETIERGFGLAQIGGNVHDVSRRTLPELRETLSTVLVENVRLMACSALQLINLHPLKGRADDPEHYLALMLPLDDTSNQDVTSQLYKDVKLVMGMQSELIRRLAMCFCPAMWATQGNSHTNPLVFAVCRDLSAKIFHQKENIFFELELAKRVFIPDLDPKRSETVMSPRCLEIAIAFHSAAVYTKALSDACITAEELARTSSSDNNVDIVFNLITQCETIKDYLKSLETYIFVVDLHLAKLKSPQEAKLTMASDVPSMEAQVSSVIPVGTSNLEVVAEELQVYEAQSCAEGNSINVEDIGLGVQRRVESEINQRLYNELSNVLAVRAEDMRRREALTLGILYNSNQESDLQVAVVSQENSTIENQLSEYAGDEHSTQDDAVVIPATGSESELWPLPRLPVRPRPPRNANLSSTGTNCSTVTSQRESTNSDTSINTGASDSVSLVTSDYDRIFDELFGGVGLNMAEQIAVIARTFAVAGEIDAYGDVQFENLSDEEHAAEKQAAEEQAAEEQAAEEHAGEEQADENKPNEEHPHRL